MKVHTTSQAQKFTIDYATSIFAGYGYQNITVEIVSENGDRNEFSHKTNNMPDFDEATNLEEPQAKYEALFELVENALDGEISEWLSELSQ